MAARGKRPCPDTEPFDDAFHSDGEHPVSGAAERKRELERNRRNLVNVRFAELEKELSNLPGAPIRMCRRIDKEVVLKDAAQRLSSQQRELVAAASRINTMVNEIETLRSEKLELRQDKAYLHKELEAVRREKKLLIRDTVILWQALRKAGGIKSVLSNEITRIPAQMLLHPALTQAALNGQAKALDAAMSLHKRQKTGEDSKDIISAPGNINGNADVSGGDADNKSPSTTNGTKCSMGSESECTSGSSAAPGVDGARGNGTVTNEFEKPQNGELEDTLRVLQTAEDMGDLLAAYGAAAESFLPLNAMSQSNDANYSGVDNAEGIDHRISSSFLRNAIDVVGRPLDFSGQYNFDQKEALYHSSGAGVGIEDQDPVPTDIAYCG